MRIVIASGYFNPLHAGHIDYLTAAKKLGDALYVIINNDKQQMLKKSRIIMDEDNRWRVVNSLACVDRVFIATDTDSTVCETLKYVSSQCPNIDTLLFVNGGDRDSDKKIPEAETCHELGIPIVIGVGGFKKRDSSTRIINEMENEPNGTGPTDTNTEV